MNPLPVRGAKGRWEKAPSPKPYVIPRVLENIFRVFGLIGWPVTLAIVLGMVSKEDAHPRTPITVSAPVQHRVAVESEWPDNVTCYVRYRKVAC
jgi:hypothetical protein